MSKEVHCKSCSQPSQSPIGTKTLASLLKVKADASRIGSQQGKGGRAKCVLVWSVVKAEPLDATLCVEGEGGQEVEVSEVAEGGLASLPKRSTKVETSGLALDKFSAKVASALGLEAAPRSFSKGASCLTKCLSSVAKCFFALL